MQIEDKPRFARLLADVLAGYGKPLPETVEINVWFKQLAPFQPSTITQAFEAYRLDRPDFAPTPNGIAARCKLLDGRPDENEAWALALQGRDEADTVVWTTEIEKAFNLVRPMLLAGDEIGARMAFKDAYKRLVSEARASNRPATWSVSAGWDDDRRQLAVDRAVCAGLLAGPEASLALPNESCTPRGKPDGLKRVMEALAKLEDPLKKAERLSEAQQAAEDEAERLRRQELDRKVQAYLRAHPEARYGALLQSRAKQAQ